MTDEEFDDHVAATETREDGTVGGLDYCLLKLSAEAGEVAGLRGKEILLRTPTTNAPERRAAYALELGDVRWYTVEAERLLGLTADQVKRLNIMKLRRRRETFPGGGLRHGKDPAGELAEAVAILSEHPTAATKPVECMAQHSYAEGCPLVCSTPTKCGESGCQARRPDEFQPCVYCEDLTRHRADVPNHRGTAAVCRAPECRALQARAVQKASCE